jgi:LCP family protein required for cell wall assembly
MEPVALPTMRRRRTWGQRTFFVLIMVIALCTLLSSIGLALAVRDLNDVVRFDLAGNLSRAPDAPLTADQIEVSVPPGGDAEALEPSGPPGPAENYLLVGSDNASGVAADSPILIDREENEGVYLADTIMLLRLRPEDGTAYLLSIPRDLAVDIEGLGHRKINSAYNLPDREAGAARLIDTIEDNLGVPIQHYIEVDLAGFTRLVDAVGGVDMCFEHPTRNPNTGLDIPTAGVHHLDGTQALQFVRSRAQYEEFIDDRWQRGTGSDLERIQRQQAFLSATIDQALSSGLLTSATRINRLLGIVADTVTISNTLNVFDDGLDLAGWFRDFGTERLTTEQLAVQGVAGSTQLALAPEAEAQLDRLRGIDPGAVVPKRVDLTVAGDDQGERDGIIAELEAIGFEPDWDYVQSAPGGVTTIRYGPGGEPAALLVAAHLDGPIEWAPDGERSGNTVVVDLPQEPPAVLTAPRVVPTPPPAAPAAPPTSGSTETTDSAATTTTPPICPA